MADKAIYSVDTVSTMADTDKVYVNTGNNIKQISKDNLCGNDIKALNDNLTELKVLGWNVPKECPIQNSVSGNTFTQKVGRIDLGSLSYTKENTSSGLNAYRTKLSNIAIPSSGSIAPNYYISGYKTVSNSSTWTDKIVSIDVSNRVVIVDNSYSNESLFRSAKQGQYLYYELATYKTFNIDGNEVSERIENDLSDYGLNNVFDGELLQGFWSDTLTLTGTTNTNNVCPKIPIPCNANDVCTVKFASKHPKVYIKFFDSSNTMLKKSSVDGSTMITDIAPTNATKFVFTCDETYITPQTCGHVGVYVNNQIDVVKNDLSNYGKVIFNGNVSSGTAIQCTENFMNFSYLMIVHSGGVGFCEPKENTNYSACNRRTGNAPNIYFYQGKSITNYATVYLIVGFK